MIKTFTILNEFSQYSETEVLGFSGRKINLVYSEALRQRASKAKLLAELIIAPYKKEEQQKAVNSLVNKMLNPHNIVVEYDNKHVDTAWNILRGKRK